jgi:hypothetical protein
MAPCCQLLRSPSANITLNTQLIQSALDDATRGVQCGCVSLGGGDYPVAGVRVRSNTEFHIEASGRLLNVINVTKLAVVNVDTAQNVTITGPGTIYGDAEHAWRNWSDLFNRMSPYFDDGSTRRTHLLLVSHSRDVVVRDLHLHNSTDWTVRLDASQNIHVENVDIYGDSRFPNNDGFDPQSCINVTLIHSRIDVADDGICPKADAAMGPLRGLYVHNVSVRSKSHAIKFGSNTDTEMSDIVFDRIRIWDSNSGLAIQQRSEGNIRNVTWSNIRLETRYEAPRWWGNGEWLVVTNTPRGNGHAIGSVRGMRFVNISGVSENGGLLSGLSGHGIRDITFENIHIRIAAWSNYSSGPTPCYAAPPICTNESAPKCVAHPLQTDSAMRCMGSRDYRPTPPGVDIPDGYAVRSPALADALYLENAQSVALRNVTFEFATPRLSWFGRCVAVDNRSSGVTGLGVVRCINGDDAAAAAKGPAGLRVHVDGSRAVHVVDDSFVSVTMDTGGLASGYASADLESADVINLARAMAPAYLRLSGGMADGLGFRQTDDEDAGAAAQVVLPHARPPHVRHCVGGDCGNCDAANRPGGPPAVAIPSQPDAWFNRSSWRRINTFAAAAGLKIVFGLNSKARARTDTPWDGRFGMAALINWTTTQPPSLYPVVGWQLGNEPDLFCRSNQTILPALLAADNIALRRRLRSLAGGQAYRISGPHTAGIGDRITNSTTGNPQAIYLHYFAQLANNLSEIGGGDVLDELSFHQYYFKGPTGHAAQFIDVATLDTLSPKIKTAMAHAAVARHGAVQLGETSSAYDGGTPNVSDSFASTFSWVDKLGLSARLGLSRVVRQQLCCGSAYDLLQQRGHLPTPDYWATLLWKRLMGGRVLAVQGDEEPGRELRAYAHCAVLPSNTTHQPSTAPGAVAVALINLRRDPTPVDLRVLEGTASAQHAAAPQQRREVYILTTVEGSFTGHRAALNGRELKLDAGGVLPALEPNVEAGGPPLVMPPLSVAFVVLPGATATACDLPTD